MKTLTAGQQAPDFTATLADGTTTRLADHRGQAMLLIFLRHLA